MPYNNITDRSDASALIPEEAASQIIQDLPKTSVALTRFRRVTMSRKQQRMPVLSALPTAYFVEGDTGLKQTTEQAWTNKYLNAEELAVIVPIPEAVLDDTEFDMWTEIRPRLVEALGIAVDGAVLFGTNKPASWPDAIEDGAAAAGNAFTRASVANKDLVHDINKCMGLVEADGFDVNGFLARKSLKADLRDLRDSNGQPIYSASLTSPTPMTVYAEPVQYVDNGAWDNTRADLICGDFTQGIMAVRQDLQWKLLSEAVIQDNTGAIIYNLAQQDMVALRVTMRVAFQVANPTTRLNPNGSTRYPFSVLRPAGFV